MADTTFTWAIAQLERLAATGEIQTVHYTVAARSEDQVYASSAYGSLGLDPADPDNMIPFADVTEAEVVSWLQAKFGEEKVAEIHQALSAQIDEQRAPKVAQGLPWSAAPAAA
jgi:hypothetical protein